MIALNSKKGRTRFGILTMVGILFVVTLAFYYKENGEVAIQENGEVAIQETSVDKSSGSVTEAESSIKEKMDHFLPVDSKSESPLAHLSYLTHEYLEAHWQEEYGCNNPQEDGELQCDFPELSASSYEEAVWMINNGYPPATLLDELNSFSNEQLESLSRSTRHWLPALNLSLRVAESGDRMSADSYFRRSKTRQLNSYALLKHGESLVMYPDPNAPGWSYRTAAVQFEKAALLGDYVGNAKLMELYHAYWGGRPGIISEDVIKTADWEISRYFDLPKHRWPVQDRPGRGG